MNPVAQFAEMYHLPNVTHGRFNLNPAPMLAGVVDTSGLKASKPTLEGLVHNPREHLTAKNVNLCVTKDVPATQVPLGMVRLEMRG